MRIVILGTRGFPNVQGGVEKHCEEIAVNLVRLGCEVIVFTRTPYVDVSLKAFRGVKLHALPTQRSKSLEAFFHTFIGIFAALKYKPDILNVQAIGPGIFIPLARLMGMRVILTSHGSNYEHQKWGKFARVVLRLGEYFGVKFSNKIIAISKTIAEEILAKYGKNPTFIPNGVVVPDILKSETTLNKYELKKNNYIISVGRFVEGKGFEVLIDAFIAWRKSNINQIDMNNWKLVIVGGADHEDKYSLFIREKASRNKSIILTGILAGKPLQKLYSHAGLFVLPSYYEGLSIVLLEAMSYGLSCIASNIPANRDVELLAEDRFFKAGDIDELTKKIEAFVHQPLTDEERTIQLRGIKERYDWKKIADKTLEVYEQVVGK